LSSVETLGFGSRAGAGALAALVPNLAEWLTLGVGARTSGRLTAVSILVSAAAGEGAAEMILGAEACAAGFAIGAEAISSLVISRGSASVSVIPAGTEATILGCGAAF
jgi:hypothetical protein